MLAYDTSKPRKLLRIEALRAKLGGVSRQTVYRWMKVSGFPQPIKASRRVALWEDRQVESWLDERT